MVSIVKAKLGCTDVGWRCRGGDVDESPNNDEHKRRDADA